MTTPAPLGPIARFLADDHVRLDALLARAPTDPAAYAEFRKGLLRHIAMEEKQLLPAAQRVRGGEPLPAAARLRLDHGALAALLVPTPTPALLRAIHGILVLHNPVEEGPDGVYAECERLLADESATLVAGLAATPEVPVHANVDSDLVMDALGRALARAGYSLGQFR